MSLESRAGEKKGLDTKSTQDYTLHKQGRTILKRRDEIPLFPCAGVGKRWNGEWGCLFFESLCVCVACVYIRAPCVCLVPMKFRRRNYTPATGVRDGCEPSLQQKHGHGDKSKLR